MANGTIDLHKQIEIRAYQIYIRRTQSEIWGYGQLGTAWGDWMQAEREVILEQKAVTNRIKDLV